MFYLKPSSVVLLNMMNNFQKGSIFQDFFQFFLKYRFPLFVSSFFPFSAPESAQGSPFFRLLYSMRDFSPDQKILGKCI